jgi:arylsulfatase A-like enzyme
VGDIEPPETVDEDLSTKPVVQREFLALFNLTGAVDTPEKQRNYLNFYGNLMKASDQYLVDVLHALDETGLRDNTVVIRTADHGEMGLAHGGLRQKNFNFYEESLRVPLIFSSPAARRSTPGGRGRAWTTRPWCWTRSGRRRRRTTWSLPGTTGRRGSPTGRTCRRPTTS